MSKILIGKSENGKNIVLNSNMLCRHGVIGGATGTGKTVTLRVIIEGLSQQGIPCFISDMKGDLSGIARKGSNQEFKRKAKEMKINDFAFEAFPCAFWDIFKESGMSIKTTVEEVGVPLLSRMLKLTNIQSGVLNIIFKVAQDENFKLHTLSDLRKVIKYVVNNKENLSEDYGNIHSSSVSSIIRALLGLEQQRGESLFGDEPFNLQYLMCRNERGQGVVSILDCVKLIREPLLYSTFIIWLLNKLYNELEEVGDCDKPKLCLFFDESHLLFEGLPKSVTQKITQVVKLIRSKGVGVYFISQNVTDIPDSILNQLSNRIQHAVRAYTKKELSNLKATAQTFRQNPNLDIEECLYNMGVGQAVVSCLNSSGIPQQAEKTFISPPKSDLTVLNNNERIDYDLTLCESFFRGCKPLKNTVIYNDVPTVQKSPQEPKNKPKKENAKINNTKILNNVANSIFNTIFR